MDTDADKYKLRVAPQAPLSERVNNEPAILKGLSSSETTVAALCFTPLWFVIGGLLSLLLQRWQIVMALTIIGPAVSVWYAAGYFATLKRNRPDHYYQHAFVVWRHRLGLSKTPFIVQRGPWELGRILRPQYFSGSRFVKAINAVLGVR